MADKTIKVNPDLHKEVDHWTQVIGGKIGKFYDIAVREKLDREYILAEKRSVKKNEIANRTVNKG